jgi:hypothetical protein
MTTWAPIMCKTSQHSKPFSRYYYYMNGNNLLRNTFNQTGMKFYFDTKAKGRTFSYERVLLECATLFSLWRVLDMFMDLIILWIPGNFKKGFF